MGKKQNKVQLVKEIKDLKSQISQLTNNWKKALADYQNLEKQMILVKKEWVDFANQQLVLKFLPIYDNLLQVVQHSPDKGLQLTVEEFKKVLTGENLQEIEILPEKTNFDEKLMDCVEVNPGQDGKILKICQPGYILKDKLIRPAKVIVGKKNC